MEAYYNKTLHERALVIIELIETADNRIKTQRENIKRLEGHFFYNEKMCEKKLESLQGAKQWLERAYDRTNNRLKLNK